MPCEGKFTYRGDPATPDLPLALKREVTTVFQRPMLLRRSIAANVRNGQRIRGSGPDDDVAQWLDRLGLADLADAPARPLSAGEAQRVALARTLVVEPSVLLLDESTGNLDPYNVGLIEDITISDNRKRGTTVVAITHDPFQARRTADRTGLMISNRTVETANTESFFTDPQRPETIAFLRGDLLY